MIRRSTTARSCRALIRAGASLTVATPVEIDGEPPLPARYPPETGEFTVEILRELGYS